MATTFHICTPSHRHSPNRNLEKIGRDEVLSSKKKRVDYAKILEEMFSENPGIARVIDKLFLKRSFKWSFIMSGFWLGLILVANALIAGFNIGWTGLLLVGAVLTVISLYYIVKEMKR